MNDTAEHELVMKNRLLRMAKIVRVLGFALLAAHMTGLLGAQDTATVAIVVDANSRVGAFKPVSSYFGYDEPNYTYTRNGSKLISELAAANYSRIYIRTHFLLATGDGTAGLKWGSTNAYTEDGSGKPVYDWKIVDRIFNTYLEAGAKPFVEIGFMPQALSSHPVPYQPTWVPGAANRDYSIGWSYPPKDYDKWGELVYQWVRHCVEKYGKQEVESWYWEVWNEPDIFYWHGTPEEYDKLYDYAATAVKRALPSARVGGPATTGPSSPKAAAFLQQFLEHCDHGKNLATGAAGAPLDFITYHAKGQPKLAAGRVRMGIAKNLHDVDSGYEIVARFPKFRGLPIVLSESDPEGCAACPARVYPQNAYRNGPLYPAYTAVMLKNILELAGRRGTNIEGMLSWAFEFEDQPYFEGFRTLATNGVDKPVLNFFRVAGLMHGDRIKVESSGRVPLDRVMQEGVVGAPDVDALATRSDHEIAVMVWNYHDDDLPGPEASVDLNMQGIADAARHVLLRHYRIDQTHSNAYTLWKSLGSPQNPSPQQYAALEAAGQLQELDSPQWVEVKQGGVKLNFKLPRHAVSLLQLSW
jgi:xylan 1,4-beta-xylosidase